jgi:hypothetical protein
MDGPPPSMPEYWTAYLRAPNGKGRYLQGVKSDIGCPPAHILCRKQGIFFFLNFQDSVELEKNTPLTKKKKIQVKILILIVTRT